MDTQKVKEVAHIDLGGVSTPIYQIINQSISDGKPEIVRESKVSDFVLRCSHVYIALKRSFLSEKRVRDLFTDVLVVDELGYVGIESVKEFCNKRGLAYIGYELDYVFEGLCETPLQCIGNVFLSASKTLLLWGTKLNPQVRVKDIENLFGVSLSKLGCFSVYECVKFEYKDGEFVKEETGNLFADMFVEAEQLLNVLNGSSTLEISLRGELARVMFQEKALINGAKEIEELYRNERLELLFDRYSKQEITEALKTVGRGSAILQALNKALFDIEDVDFEECK